MPLRKLDVKSLDYIVEQMISTVEQSKSEVFRIGEQCRHDHDALIAELKEIKEPASKRGGFFLFMWLSF